MKKGSHHTPEAKEKMGAAHKLRWKSISEERRKGNKWLQQYQG